MKSWLTKIANIFHVDETLTREKRQEIILRAALIFTMGTVLVALSVNILSLQKGSRGVLYFYTSANIFTLILLMIIWYFNEKHYIRLASRLYMAAAFFLCLTAIPLDYPDQVLLYLTIPNLIICFIAEKRAPLYYVGFSIATYTGLYFFNNTGEPYNFFSVLCFLVIIMIAWGVSQILDVMFDQLVSAYDTTIEGWSQALEMRSQETEGHSHRVCQLTMQLVKQMHLDETRWTHIQRGVLLHDIGKMGVPDQILCKNGPLTESEMAIMREHPIKAYQLLNKIPYLQPALQIPYCHHEKWDGSGYPRGLKGEEIPLEARIFSVVDVWDAMRSHRSYRDAIPENQVIEYLRSESGRSFDPAIIKAFFDLMGFKDPQGIPAGTRLSLEKAPGQREI